jgi:hypothetical protein
MKYYPVFKPLLLFAVCAFFFVYKKNLAGRSFKLPMPLTFLFHGQRAMTLERLQHDERFFN